MTPPCPHHPDKKSECKLMSHRNIFLALNITDNRTAIRSASCPIFPEQSRGFQTNTVRW